MGKVKNWTVEKKDEIESILIEMWAGLGMDVPENYEEIVQDCYEDVCETADPMEWHSGDVAIAFRRWIEKQSNRPVPMSEDKPDIGLDGMYGNQLNTVGELRDAMSELSDDDQITLVAIDLETGDEQDHYPMHLDVIDNIRLTDGTVVNEVQFVQERNAEPDTRDKQPLVDAVIDELKRSIALGDDTVLDELLKFIPWEILKGSLPEEMWERFNNLK